jgi:hypothetical protein
MAWIYYQFELAASDHYWYVYADVYNGVAESNESNNLNYRVLASSREQGEFLGSDCNFQSTTSNSSSRLVKVMEMFIVLTFRASAIHIAEGICFSQ